MSAVSNTNQEREIRALPGSLMLVVLVIAIFGAAALFFYSINEGAEMLKHPLWPLLIVAVVVELVSLMMLSGFFTLQPNEGRVLILFGAYKGTVRQSGFHWGNPFYSNGDRNTFLERLNKAKSGDESSARGRNKISLRARTLNGGMLKVNDKRGNPIEIAAIVIWRVNDTAQALFDVDDYEKYVHTQSESALRHMASCYAYDHGEENEITLRSGVDGISLALQKELQERLAKAGVGVEEARLTHLAYAPEIAQVMLRRQQAEAVIAARQTIVHGAVSMVDMALRELTQKQVVTLDDERKASMVSNLMVVLCSESEVHPIVNTGTLYT